MSKRVGFIIVILLLLIVGTLSFQKTELPKKGNEVSKKSNSLNQTTRIESKENSKLLINNDIKPSPSSDESSNGSEGMTGPLPNEWEDSFFSILNNSSSREDRNTKLILFATTSAKNSPRVQQECLSHITYGLTENDGDLALQVLKDDRIAISARRQMFKDLLKIRSDDFCYYLSSGLVSVGDQGISSEAKANLLKYVKSEQKPKEGNTSK